ncbi:hypothetical protein QVD17_18138 [Tagetes erecta]|uniref:PHD-type domain-containing protein n=1 Tax=Tagetes erecta TaxID=13708 RepID=A0AAD8KH07_TARER|nr:hypothetical protein QVD17_18138 [Tagetes erecta]
MEVYKHFSHPHSLCFHQSLDDAQITCTGCNFPCTNTAVYSCRSCKFFLHDQCFNATRSLIHPSHPDHPLSLFPSPTYTSGSFTCKSCNETGSGFCFGCSACDFDLHIHCAYNTLNPKPSSNLPPNQIILESRSNEHTLSLLNVNPIPSHNSQNPKPSSNLPPNQIILESRSNEDTLSLLNVNPIPSHNTLNPKPSSNLPPNQIILESRSNEDTLSLLHVNPIPSHNSQNPEPTSNTPPTQIKLKSHPKHPLSLYLHKSACRGCTCFCDVCGTASDPDSALYRCDICDYGLHVECASLPETIRREDHEHALSLLYVNPNPEYLCDVCRGEINQKNCMYICTSGCDYGTHVKCVSDKVSERDWMDELEIAFDISKLKNKMRELMQSHWPLAIMVVILAILIVAIYDRRYYGNPYHQQYYPYSYCDGTRCVYHNPR